MDRPLAVVNAVNTASPATWYVHVDLLNRPIKMTDGAKASVWTAVWQPWGSPQSITGTATLDARFPGQWYQLEAGLHYNWHRHYDPSLGRYTQPDPLGFVDGPSVYAYAGSAPHRWVDRDGRFLQFLPAAIEYFCARFPGACIALTRQTLNKCVQKIKDFIKDEQGARKRDLKQVDDALAQVEREQNIQITQEMRRKFHDEIEREYGRDATYSELVDLARSLFGR